MEKEIKIYEGVIKRDSFGSWSDCDPGLYIDFDKIETIFSNYYGKNIKITIEEIRGKYNE